MTITLAEMKLQARQRADMESSEFIGEAELTAYINNSIAELYDILTDAYGSEYFVESVTGSITAETASYALPTDFYELKAVDIRLDNQDWVNVQRFNFNERNRATDFSSWDLSALCNIRYRIMGNNLLFTPIPDTSAEYQLWYVPVFEKLTDDSDTFDEQNAYSEYVIVDAAIKMLQKQEDDVSVLMAQKQALEKRIRDKSQARDAGSAPTISDLSP
jgi:hypothetical protein